MVATSGDRLLALARAHGRTDDPTIRMRMVDDFGAFAEWLGVGMVLKPMIGTAAEAFYCYRVSRGSEVAPLRAVAGRRHLRTRGASRSRGAPRGSRRPPSPCAGSPARPRRRSEPATRCRLAWAGSASSPRSMPLAAAASISTAEETSDGSSQTQNLAVAAEHAPLAPRAPPCCRCKNVSNRCIRAWR